MSRYRRIKCTFKMDFVPPDIKPVDKRALADQVRMLAGSRPSGTGPGELQQFLYRLSDAISAAGDSIEFPVELTAEEADLVRINTGILAERERNWHVGHNLAPPQYAETQEAAYALIRFQRAWSDSTGWNGSMQEATGGTPDTMQPALGSGYRK